MNNWRIRERVVSEWKLKLLGGSVIFVAFWAVYFALENFVTANKVIVMPESALDRIIPFRPTCAFFYISQFLTMPAIMWLLDSRRAVVACFQAVGIIMLAGFMAFCFYPTAIARPSCPSGQHFFYSLIARYDLPRNACPSLHAAFAVVVAACARNVFRGWKHGLWLVGFSWLWTGLVVVSTLLIKQHVVLDLIVGGLLGMASWLAANWAEREANQA
jgi:membrane-associated phospholipid phosphatase